MSQRYGIITSMKLNKSRPKSQKQIIGKSADKWMEDLWEKLADKIAKTESPKEVRNILENLVSKDEKKMILRRLAILALVTAGKSYQEIGEILWTSSQTISTLKKNALSLIGNYQSYRNFYGGPKKWNVIKTEKTFLEKLFGDLDIMDLLKNPPRPRGIGLKKF